MKAGSNHNEVSAEEKALLRTAKVVTKTWPHQQAAIDDALAGKRRFLLFFVMGTGKTLTTIGCILAFMVKCRTTRLKVLILVPNNAVINWWRQFETHAPAWVMERIGLLDQKSSKERIAELRSSTKTIWVTNHETLRGPLFQEYIRYGFHVLVLDELHAFKNPKSIQFKRARDLADRLPFALGLTGSPQPNKLSDLWGQCRIIAPAALGSNFFAFMRQNFENANANMPWLKFPKYQPKEGAQEAIMEKLSPYTYIAGLDVLGDSLPPIIKQVKTVPLASELARSYKQMERDCITFFANSDEAIVAKMALEKILRLRQIANGIISTDGRVTKVLTEKDAELDSILEQLTDSGAQVIVWTDFLDTLPTLEHTGAKYARTNVLRGGLHKDARQRIVDGFQSGDTRVVVATTQSTRLAIDLTAASHMIYYSKNYNLEHDEQSQARAHRSGQTKTVVRIDLVTENTVEEDIHAALLEKKTLQDLIFTIKTRGER